MKFARCFLIFCCLLFPIGIVQAAEQQWIWVCSNEYHTHFYMPEYIDVEKSDAGNIATIAMWRKTTYNYAGAQKEFEEQKKLAEQFNPSQLAYSIQRIELNLPRREFRVVRTIYHDREDRIMLLVDDNSPWYEMEPFYKEEDFFSKIQDIFNDTHDDEMRNSKDRWLKTGHIDYSDGTSFVVYNDKMSIMKRKNVYHAWQRISKYGANHKLVEIDHIKIAYDLRVGTMGKLKRSSWRIDQGWVCLQKDDVSNFEKPIPGTVGAAEIEIMRNYVQNNQDFILRSSKPRPSV